MYITEIDTTIPYTVCFMKCGKAIITVDIAKAHLKYCRSHVPCLATNTLKRAPSLAYVTGQNVDMAGKGAIHSTDKIQPFFDCSDFGAYTHQWTHCILFTISVEVVFCYYVRGFYFGLVFIIVKYSKPKSNTHSTTLWFEGQDRKAGFKPSFNREKSQEGSQKLPSSFVL